jgi:general secretion pathway protein E
MGIPADRPPTLYHHKGCDACNQLGYHGRTGIYELVIVDDVMRSMIHDGAGEMELEREARKNSPGIRQDGWRKVLSGETTVQEVLRVTQGD